MNFSDCCRKCRRYSWIHISIIDEETGEWMEKFCNMKKKVDCSTQTPKAIARAEFCRKSKLKPPPYIFNRQYNDKELFLRDIEKFEPDEILPGCSMQIELSLILFEKNSKKT